MATERQVATQNASEPVNENVHSEQDVVQSNDEGGNETVAATKTKLWTVKNLLLLLPVIINPLIIGYNNGIFGVYLTMYEYATNCELYKAQKPCETLSGAKCTWMAATDSQAGACGWAELTTCYRTYTSEAPCKADPVCAWNVKSDRCGNQVGYTASLTGLFGAGMKIGALIGSFISGTLTSKLNFRPSFFGIGLLATIASVLTHVSTAYYNFWVMFVARIVLGLAIGWQNYASSAFVNMFAPKDYRVTFGTVFQVTMSFGAFFGPVMGLCVGYTIAYSSDIDANVKGRMQGLVSFATFLAVLSMIVLPMVTKNTPTSHDEEAKDESGGNAPKATSNEKYKISEVIFPCFIAVTMSATLQLTGISAVTNYAPKIMGSYGLNPLVGNVVLMAWNAVTVFAILPLSRIIPLRTLFLVGGVITAVCCVFLCGVPVYPGVSKTETIKNGVALAGIFIYIGVYQVFVGPSYFVLAIDMFPASFRPYGMSVSIFSFTVFTTIVTLCYPIAAEGISGGPSGNPDKGQAVAFIFFGCIGLIAAAIEYFFMHSWESKHNKNDEKHNVDDQ